MSDAAQGGVTGYAAGDPSRPPQPERLPDVAAEFDRWLRRLGDTHDALAYTCGYRIGDQVLAREVSFRVMSALVGKPQVFQYYGLPYSGRIASVAEPLIARARRGDLAVGPSTQWEELLQELATMPDEVRHVVAVGYVLGYKGEALGAMLGCDGATADRRRESTVAWMRAAAPAWLSEL